MTSNLDLLAEMAEKLEIDESIFTNFYLKILTVEKNKKESAKKLSNKICSKKKFSKKMILSKEARAKAT